MRNDACPGGGIRTPAGSRPPGLQPGAFVHSATPGFLPGEGVEPSRPLVGHWVLSPTRLPIPPPGLCYNFYMNNYTKNKNVLQSFLRAYQGFLYIYHTHKHFRLNIFIGLLIIILSILLKFTNIQLTFIFLAVLLVFFAEVINTCFEEICNLITTEYHPKIKVIKDLGSFLVLISVIFSLVVFLLIFLKNLLALNKF